MARQGDVLLVRVESALPAAARVVPREDANVVLAHGEASGHRHRIRSGAATLFEHDGARLLRVDRTVLLEHEEHAPIELPPGVYRVVRQRTYVPGPGREREVGD